MVWIESDSAGDSMPARVFEVKGDLLRAEGRVVSIGPANGLPSAFENRQVLLLDRFVGLTGSVEDPATIDSPGPAPSIYRVGPGQGEFEAFTWQTFWTRLEEVRVGTDGVERIDKLSSTPAPLKVGERLRLTITADGQIGLHPTAENGNSARD
jgi:hypothetical protein